MIGQPAEVVSPGVSDEPPLRISALVETIEPVARPPIPEHGRTGGPARWVPPGETIVIWDVGVAGGFIYVGETLGPSSRRTENCLINPTLAVAKAGKRVPTGLTYFCRYDGLNPAGRRAYLEWLAAGRRDLSADIALVFLYFYGLEYRLFRERCTADAPMLVAEVERLRGIYGTNHSFQAYARTFIEAAQVFAPGIGPRPKPNLVPDFYNYQVPLDVRVHLGRKLAERRPLDADDVLLWLAALPERGFRTPVTRCPEEFEALWRLRFAADYPQGLRIAVPRARIKASYRAASSTFEVDLDGPDRSRLPDIAAVAAPPTELRDLVAACTDEIDAFSRFVGKNPEARTTVQAALLLPPDLPSAGSVWAAVGARFQAVLADGATMPAQSLRSLLDLMAIPLPEGARLSQAGLKQMQCVLDRLGVAFEPDSRYEAERNVGGAPPDADSRVLLFKAPGGGPVDPTRPEYLAMRTVVEVACLAASPDGDVSPSAMEDILARVRSADALNDTEKCRLTAFALCLRLSRPKQRGLLRRLRGRPVAERQAYISAALSAALADGAAGPAQVGFLERLHEALVLPVEDLYGALHRGSQGPSAPARLPHDVDAGQRQAALDRVPVGVAIDPSRLERIRRETEAVSSLLSGIFLDDQACGPGMAVSTRADVRGPGGHEPADVALPGLDPVHAGLLALLTASHDPMPRDAFDRVARASGLLPDGALETISEWGFDSFDEALIEHDDPVTIAAHLRIRLLPKAAA